MISGPRRVVALGMLAIIMVGPSAVAQSPDSVPTWHLPQMHHQPWFLDVLLASTVGWVVGMVKGFAGTKDWLDKYWPTSPRLVTFILDVLVFVVVGAYFGTGIYSPNSLQSALAAGLSWPIGLGALATKEAT